MRQECPLLLLPSKETHRTSVVLTLGNCYGASDREAERPGLAVGYTAANPAKCTGIPYTSGGS